MSREILLIVASGAGAFELRKIYKLIDATPTAIRLHVQSLEDEGYVELGLHETSRRCKVVRLTKKGVALMREYERKVQQALSGWQSPV